MSETEPLERVLSEPISRRQLLKRAAVGGAVGLSLPSLVAACGGGDEEEEPAGGTRETTDLSVYSVTHGTPGDPFWAVYRKGLQDGEREFGVGLTDQAPEQFSVEALVDMLNSAVAAKPDGIIATITDPSAVEAPLRDAVDEGIPVIAVNVPDTRGADERIPYLFYVGGNEEFGGRVAAERILREGKPTRAACAIQEAGHVGLQARCRGFDDVMKSQGVPTNTIVIEGGNPTRSAEILRGYFTKNRDTNALFTLGPQGATPAIQVLEEQQLTDKVTHMTFDLSQEQVDQIKQGTILGTIGQQQYLQGYLPMLLLKLNLQHGFSLASDVLTGPFLVDEANIGDVEEGVKEGLF